MWKELVACACAFSNHEFGLGCGENKGLPFLLPRHLPVEARLFMVQFQPFRGGEH